MLQLLLLLLLHHQQQLRLRGLLLEQSQQSFLQRATLAQHPEQEGHEHLEEHHGFEDRS